MSDDDSATGQTQHYYVDEAGDGTLFNRRKKIVVGTEGCSTYFALGLLAVADPPSLEADITDLRTRLLSDPYLAKIPSMQAANRKTAVAFHAKDDCPEVRREVYQLLMKHDVRFFAVVRDKRVIVEKVKAHNATHPDYRYRPDQLYDRCVSRLFRDRLHKEDAYRIVFATRGNRPRTKALRESLDHARRNLQHVHGIEATSPIEILPSNPGQSAGLQAADYFLWALQRLYERREDRYWEYVSASVSLVHDVDDTRENDYGMYYDKRHPLTLESPEPQKKPGI